MKIEDITDNKYDIQIPEAEVTEIGETRTVNTRFGNEANVADVRIKDDTAEITLSLWNDDIKDGDPIGTVGSTGFSTGTHLHYEIFRFDQRTNPEYYLNS